MWNHMGKISCTWSTFAKPLPTVSDLILNMWNFMMVHYIKHEYCFLLTQYVCCVQEQSYKLLQREPTWIWHVLMMLEDQLLQHGSAETLMTYNTRKDFMFPFTNHWGYQTWSLLTLDFTTVMENLPCIWMWSKVRDKKAKRNTEQWLPRGLVTFLYILNKL